MLLFTFFYQFLMAAAVDIPTVPSVTARFLRNIGEVPAEDRPKPSILAWIFTESRDPIFHQNLSQIRDWLDKEKYQFYNAALTLNSMDTGDTDKAERLINDIDQFFKEICSLGKDEFFKKDLHAEVYLKQITERQNGLKEWFRKFAGYRDTLKNIGKQNPTDKEQAYLQALMDLLSKQEAIFQKLEEVSRKTVCDSDDEREADFYESKRYDIWKRMSDLLEEKQENLSEKLKKVRKQVSTLICDYERNQASHVRNERLLFLGLTGFVAACFLYWYFVYESGTVCNWATWMLQSLIPSAKFNGCESPIASVATPTQFSPSLSPVPAPGFSNILSPVRHVESVAPRHFEELSVMATSGMWDYLKSVPGLYPMFIQLFGLPTEEITCSALQNNATLTVMKAVQDYQLAANMLCYLWYSGGSIVNGKCINGTMPLHWITTPEMNADGISCGGTSDSLFPGHMQIGIKNNGRIIIVVNPGIADRSITSGLTITPEHPHQKHHTHSGSKDFSASRTPLTGDTTITHSNEITKRTGSPSDQSPSISFWGTKTGSRVFPSHTGSGDDSETLSGITQESWSISQETPSFSGSPTLDLQMYWANFNNKTICWNNVMPGSSIAHCRLLLQGNSSFLMEPSGLFVDTANNHIYFVDYMNGNVYVGDIGDPLNPLAITNVKKLIDTAGANWVYQVFLDLKYQKLYWSGYNFNLKVGSINPKNPAPPTNIVSPTNGPRARSFVIDRLRGKIYWGDINTGNLCVGNINPQNPTAITSTQQLTSYSATPFMMDLTDNQIFYRTGNPAVIKRGEMNFDAPTAPTAVTNFLIDSKNLMGGEGNFLIGHFEKVPGFTGTKQDSESPSPVFTDPRSISKSRTEQRVVFYTNNANSRIGCVQIDPTLNNSRVLLQGNTTYMHSPSGIHVDTSNGNIYWTNIDGGYTYFGKTNVYNPMNISNTQVLLQQGPGWGYAVYVDAINGFMYFGGSSGLRVGRMNASAPAAPTNVTTLSGGSYNPNPLSIYVDPVHGKIYVADSSQGEVAACNINATNPTSITNCSYITNTGYTLTAMSILENMIYWMGGTTPYGLYVSYLNRTNANISSTRLLATDPGNIINGGIFPMKI